MSDNSTLTIQADFSNRDAAERAIEHLVQEHGIVRGDIFVRARDAANSAGSEKSGPDASSGPADGSAFQPQLYGPIEVSVDVNNRAAAKVADALKSAGASRLATH